MKYRSRRTRKELEAERYLRFSIRKFNVGTASVAVAAALMFMGGPGVRAEEIPSDTNPEQSQTTEGSPTETSPASQSTESSSIAETAPATPSVDKSALTSLLAEVAALDVSGKTEASRTALATAVEAAKLVETDSAASQEAVDAAVTEVKAALLQLEDQPVETKVSRLVPISYKVQYVDAVTGDVISNEHRLATIETTEDVAVTDVTVTAKTLKNHVLAEGQASTITQTLRSDQNNLITFKVVAKTATVAESAPATSTETPAAPVAPVAPTVETPTEPAPVIAETPVQDQAAATEESKLVEAEATAAPSAVTANSTETASLSDPVLLAAASQVEDRGFTGFRAQTTGTSNTTPAAAGSGVTTGLKVQFFDASGQEITDTTGLDALNGKNVLLNIKATFDQSMTNKTVTIKLGNFINFVDAGTNNDSVKAFVTNFSAIAAETPILASNGQKYRDKNGTELNWNTGRTITYTLKSETEELTIPIIISTERLHGMYGYAADGDLNGVVTGIERSVPVTVSLSAEQNSQAVSQVGTINELTMSQRSTDPSSHTYDWYNSTLSPQELKSASSSNGYMVVPGFGLDHVGTSGYFNYIEDETIDLILPRGVAYISMSDGTGSTNQAQRWQLEKQIDLEDGAKRLTFRIQYPSAHIGHDFLPKLYVDRAVHTGSSLTVQTDNHMIKYRNNTDFYKLRGALNYTVRVFDLTDQDDIGYFQDVPGVPYSFIETDSGQDSLEGKYVRLGTIFETKTIINFDSHDSREKEIVYDFPANEYYEVKGITLPILSNDVVISSVKVKTRNVQELRTVQLSKSYSKNDTKSVFLDLTELGYEADDVLESIIIPQGVIPGDSQVSKRGNWFLAEKRTQVFGTVLKSTEGQIVTVAQLTLRDKDYNPIDPQRNQINGTNTMQASSRASRDRNDLRVMVDSTKSLNYGETGTVTYRISSMDDEWARHEMRTDEVGKAYLVLPSSIPVKEFRIAYNKIGGERTYITSEVVRSQRQEGENTIYAFDFTNVQGDYKHVGWFGRSGEDFFLREIQLELVLENKQVEATSFEYRNRLFVTTPHVEPRIGSVTQKADPFDVDGDGLRDNDTDVFTDKNAGSALFRFNTADRIDFQTSIASAPSDSNTFRILDTSSTLGVTYTITNPLPKEVGNIDLLIPIPKKGQNWGTNFQERAFDFGLSVEGVPVGSGDFNNIFDVTYASVAESKLDGTTHTHASLIASESFTAYPDMSTVNLIRVKTKENVKLPAESELSLSTTFKLSGVQTQDDGKEIEWNSYYRGVFGDGATSNSATYATRKINLSIALGALAVQVFNDTNNDGLNSGEASIGGINYEVFDDTGLSVTKGQTATGLTTITGLISGKEYSVKFINPNKNDTRFTSGEIAVDKTFTTHKIMAVLNSGTGVLPTTQVGLTSAKTTHRFTTGTSGTLAAATAAGFYDDKIAAPAVTAKAGFTFAGWRENTGTAVLSAADLAKQDFGKTAKTYVAEYVKSTATVSLDLGATAHPDVTVKLKKGTTVVETVLIPNGTQTKTWTNLDVADYTIEVVDVAGYTETLAGGTKATTALPTNLAQYATQQAGDVQNANVQTQAFTLSLTKVADSYNPVGLTNKILVNDTNNLSSDEQTQVANAVKAANTSLPADATYVSDNKGRVTITYSDGSQDFVEAAQTVLQKGTLTAHKVNKVDSDDTAMTGTGHAGATVSVTLPNGQIKSATVGTNGQWTINLGTTVPTGTILSVTQTRTGFKDSTPVPVTVAATTAETSNPVLPASKMAVDTYGSLKPEEVAALKALVEAANPGKTVTVDATGQATVTYPDGSKDIIAASELTVQRATSAKPSINRVDTDDLVVAGTGVNGSTVTVKIGNQAAVTRPVTNGVWSVTLTTPLAAGTAISVTQKETDKLVSPAETSTVQRTTADNTTPTVPTTKVKVDNTNSLTPTEVAAVKAAVEAANPGTTATVDTKGTATVTYADGSKDTIPAAQLIEQRETSATPVVNPLDSDDTTVSGKGTPGATITVTYPDSSFISSRVKPDGSWSVPVLVDLARGESVTVSHFEDGKLPVVKQVEVNPTLAEATDLVKPSAVIPVTNPSQLTDDEIAAVRAAVQAANPALSLDQIAVSSIGDVTVTYADQTTDQLPASDVVRPKTQAELTDVLTPTLKVAVTNPSNLTEEEKEAVRALIRGANPHLPADVIITVDADGTSTVSYLDGSAETPIPGSSLVYAAADDLAQVKEDAKQAINALPYLTADQKKDFIDQIEAATDKPRIAVIVDEARVLNTAQTPADLSLDDAKAQAIAEINALPYLTEEDKAALLAKVEAAQDIPAVQKVQEDARALNDQRAAELAQAKTAAKAVIDSLPNLTPAEKAAAKDAIDKAADKPAIDAIVDAARKANDAALADKPLEEVKQAAQSEISDLSQLTPAEQAALAEQIAGATTPEEVAQILDAARALNDARAADLLKAKTAAKEAIDALPNLTAEEKAAFKAAVDAATTIPAVQAVVDEARALNDSRNGDKTLEELKAAAKAEVDTLPLLTAEEKAAFKEAIDAATTPEAVQAVLDEARNLNDSRLDTTSSNGKGETIEIPSIDVKALAKEEVNKLPHLTPAEKAAYLLAIDAAADVDAVAVIVDEARNLNAQRAAELAQAQADAKAVINALPNLTAEEKAAFVAAVDAATTIPAVTAVVDEARALNDSRNADKPLEEVKQAAIAEINALPNLTDAEKQAAIDAVNAATTPEAVQAELDKVRELNDQRAEDLLKAKTAAKEAIDALPHLTAEEKAAAKAAVDAATTIPAVQAVVDEARALNDSRNGDKTLEEVKTAAKAEVDTLPLLTDAEKAAFKEAIDAATTPEAVQAVVDEARKLNDSRLDTTSSNGKGETIEIPSIDVKALAKEEVNKLPHLTADEKAAFAARIDAAADVDAVAVIVEEARSLNAQHAEELAKAKEAAQVAIAVLLNLTDAEKADFAARIEAATSPEAVQAIVDEARALNDSRNAGQSLDATKQAAKTEIAQLPLLTDSEKADFVARIDAATTPEAVQAILDEARKLNDSRQTGGTSNGGGTNTELPTIDVKALAKEEVNALAYLTADEKAAFAARIDAAADVDAVAAIVDEARSLNAAKQLAQLTLDAAKAAAKEVIQGLGNLSAADKAALLDRLAAAADLAAVSALVEEARRLNAQAAAAQAAAQALADAKKTAIDAINQLPHLSAAEKQAYINAIQSAQNVDAVLAVLETARANAATAQVKAAKVQASSSLPATGQADSSAILSLAIAMILASLAVLGLPRKEDNR